MKILTTPMTIQQFKWYLDLVTLMEELFIVNALQRKRQESLSDEMIIQTDYLVSRANFHDSRLMA